MTAPGSLSAGSVTVCTETRHAAGRILCFVKSVTPRADVAQFCVVSPKVLQVCGRKADHLLMPQMGCGVRDTDRARVSRQRQVFGPVLPGSQARRRRRGNDSGFSLTEIVMTVGILSVVVVPTLTAVISAIRAGSLNDDLSSVETILQNAADRVNRAPKSCDYTLYAQAAAQTQGWSASTTSVVQQHYVPGPTPDVNGSWVAQACATTSPAPLAVQMVTITVASPDGSVHKSLQVVKSDV